MKSFFENLSYSDLVKMADRDHLQNVKEAAEALHLKSDIGDTEQRHKEKARHDVWNMYAYGDLIRVTYLKTCQELKTPQKPRRSDENGTHTEKPAATEENAVRFSQSLSRTKSRVFELAACNEFTHFCTFTQDKTKRDRFDLGTFRKDLAQFVRNENRGRAEEAKIKYLMIPEKHKNGGWHMHGFLKGLTASDLRAFDLSEKLPYSIRNELKSGGIVYDWSRYRRNFGYFTCTEIKDSIAAAKYITKYITKDIAATAREQGAHLFFASQGLKSRECLTWRNMDTCPFDEWDYENDYVKVKEIRLDPEKRQTIETS